jgi:small subunit ribosomal protein S6
MDAVFISAKVRHRALLAVKSHRDAEHTLSAVAPHQKKGKPMPLYEHVLIARQDISSTEVDSINEGLKSFIEDNGGKVAKVEYWGLRSMAYRMNKNRKGHYTLLAIEAPSEVLQEMERKLRINEDILRTLTIRVEEFSEDPSPILIKREERKRRQERY